MAIYHGWEPFETWRILDSLSNTEYNALTDAKKDFLRIIISAGVVNFREGSPVWNAVMVNIFPSGTATHTSLLAASERVYGESPA